MRKTNNEWHLPLDARPQKVPIEIGIRWVVQQGRRSVDYVVKVMAVEDLVPDAFGRIILYDDEVQMACVFGMPVEDLLAFRGAAHGASDLVSGADELVEDVCSDEAVGAREEDGGHF